MTYKELFYKLFPNGDLKGFCPDLVFGFATKPDAEVCDKNECDACWDRLIPEDAKLPFPTGNDARKTGVIKDSGNRREFESGAVRDMQEGKGRCDLMPLEVVGITTGQPIILKMKMFLDTGKTDYLYECLNDFVPAFDRGEKEYSATYISDIRYCTMFLEVAKHFEDGAKKYGENNWQKGIPPFL